MLDKQFTDLIQAWLQQPREERSVEQGATYLLQLTRNRHLFAFCTSGKPHAMDKLEYELNKHLVIRLNGHTMEDVVRMENALMPAVEQLIGRGGRISEGSEGSEGSEYSGKRPDHDSLPDEVKAIYEQNFDRYTRIKELYNHLLALEQAEPCDRYEYLQMLAEQDRAYREGWAAYDGYVEEAESSEGSEGSGESENLEGSEGSAKKPRRKKTR